MIIVPLTHLSLMFYQIETSQFIRATNRLAGVCLSGVLVINNLMSIYKKTNLLQKYKGNDAFLGSQTT